MRNGNGQRWPLNLRALIGVSSTPPRGPFSGREVVRALEMGGWTPEGSETQDEWLVFRHPIKPGRVPVNPDWERFWEGDSIFRCLCRDLELTPDELVQFLQGS